MGSKRIMAVVYYVGGKIVGLEADTKPTLVPENTTFIESDTQKEFIFVSGVWEPIIGSVPLFLDEDFTSYATQGEADAVWVTNDNARARVDIAQDRLNFDLLRTGTAGEVVIARTFAQAMNDAEWVMRTEIEFSLIATSNLSIHFLNGQNNAGGATSQISMAMAWQVDNFISKVDCFNVVPNAGQEGNENFVISINTRYFCEVIRTSGTTYNIRMTTNSDYTGGSQFFGTCDVNINSLDVVKLLNGNNGSGNGRMVGFINKVQIASGVSVFP